MAGYIKLHRGWRDNVIFHGEFSRADAWVWLIENACWKPARVKVKGGYQTLDRGQLCYSQRFMADAWGWSKSRVDRFICELRAEGMIETRSKIGASAGQTAGQTAGQVAGQGQSITTICNYDKYQDNDDTMRGERVPDSGASVFQKAGRARGKEEEGKEIKNNNTRAAARPSCVSEPVWADFISLRKAKRAPLTDTALGAITKEADKAGIGLEAALTECVARGWQSFKADWAKRSGSARAVTSDGWELPTC